MKPWHFVLAFGIVSLLADMVYEGARSLIGPYLATLGASATVVGLVAGAGEFIGYGLRVVSGYAVQRTRRYWTWTILGYSLTVLSVPLIGITGLMAPALLLYGTERLGKAVRSPAKDTLLSHASAQTGRGSAFGVHQALDQTGAVLGPLLLAALLGWREGDYRLAFGSLAVPGIAVIVVLVWLRRRVPDPMAYEAATLEQSEEPAATPVPRHLPRQFWQYVAAVGVLSCGVVSFPLLAFHAQTRHLLSDAQVPLLFAVAMAVDGLSGLVMGRVYDRRGPMTLLAVPIAACISVLALTDRVVVNGVLDSTVKAVVTDLVASGSRAVAFGWLAFVRGAALLVAGGVLGVSYDQSPALAIAVILIANGAALAALFVVLRNLRRPVAVRV
jgi:MFS family permease